MRALLLKPGEDRRLRAGHLWIFSNEVDTKASPLTDFEPGAPALVRDAAGRALGTAYVNPASLICARMVSRKNDAPLGADLLRNRLKTALALRERLFSRPWYRLCHSEGDFLPGLILDRYNDTLVAQCNTAGMDAQRDALLGVLHELLRPACIVLRNDAAAREAEGLPRLIEVPLGAAPARIEVWENELRIEAPFFAEAASGGQKSGWFFDQRDNRMQAARFGGGAAVLDAFCYAGGFGVAAAKGGAASVLFADASRRALDAAESNLAACAPACAGETLHGELLGEESALRRLREEGRRFDLVCLDPPALIKRRKDFAKGLASYRGLNALGLDLLKTPGVLLTSSCSHHLSDEDLRRCIASAAAKRGLRARILHQGGQAADHPVHPSMPETRYLSCFAAYITKD